MGFTLYSDDEGGHALRVETHDSVDVVDGTFTVELGAVTAFNPKLATTERLYLGFSVNNGREMTPRMPVSGTLRSRWAAHAKDVRGEDIHRNSVSIHNAEVINEQGQWVGEAADRCGVKSEHQASDSER